MAELADPMAHLVQAPGEDPVNADHVAAADRLAAGRLFLVAGLLLIFGMAARTAIDTDMWWHLRAGELTLQNGRPLLSDPFTFTRLGVDWVNHSWLSQVGMILLYQWAGLLGLSAGMAVLATASMALVYAQSEGPAAWKVSALLLGSVVASTVWSPRPQLASLVLLALLGLLLHRYRKTGWNKLWLLPLLFILWSNLHGGYILGLLLIGLVLAGEVLNHLLGIQPAMPWQRIFRLGLFGLLCLLAVLVNPNGLDTWTVPFQTAGMSLLQDYMHEWASPDFHDLLQQSLLWLLLPLLALVALSGRAMDAVDLLLVLGFAYLALIARRNYGPFALVAVPVLTRYGLIFVEAWRARAGEPPWLAKLLRPSRPASPSGSRTVKKVINLSIAAVLGLVVLVKLYAVSHPALVNPYMASYYPVGAAAWVAENRPEARLFNEYNWGGYLIWHLRGSPLFVDGRADLFGDEIIGLWIAGIQGAPGWEATLDQYAIDLVMLEPGRPLLGRLEEAGWRLLYQDKQAVVYGRDK